MDDRDLIDYLDALKAFKVVDYHSTLSAKYVRASADTGTNYEVVTTRLNHEFRDAGDPDDFCPRGYRAYVSVISPYRTVYEYTPCCFIRPDFVHAKWVAPVRGERVHMGDLAALTLAINITLDQDLDFARAELQKVYT